MAHSLSQRLLLVCGALALSVSALPALADNSDRPGTSNTATKPWPSNAAMQSGMNAMRDALAKERAGIEANHLSGPAYVKLAEFIDGQITEMLKNKIEPESLQKAFHNTILSDLQGGIALMRDSPKLEVKRVGALGVIQTVTNYGKYFQHPGWRNP